MVIQATAAKAIAIRFDEIINNLDRWGLPRELILPYKEPLPATTYISGVLSMGTLASGIAFNASGVDKYNIYKSSRDETAPIYSELGVTRNELLDEAQSRYTMRNISYGLAGAFAIYTVYQLSRKRTVSFEVNGDHNQTKTDFYFNPLSFVGGGFSGGVIVKF